MDRYLHVTSHHCPTQKMGLFHTMATRAVRIADIQNREVKKDYLRQFMQNNGYMLKNINKAIKRAKNKQTTKNQITNNEYEGKRRTYNTRNNTMTIYTRSNRTHIKNRKLIRHKTVFNTSTKIGSIFRNPKGKIPEIQNPGVHKKLRSCGKSYIGPTGRAIGVRIKEHEKDVDYRKTGKSAVAEHVEQKVHNISFSQIKILYKETNYGKQMIKEAIEIKKCHEIFNKENCWKISNA